MLIKYKVHRTTIKISFDTTEVLNERLINCKQKIISCTIRTDLRTLARGSNTWRRKVLFYERLFRTAVLRAFATEAYPTIHCLPFLISTIVEGVRVKYQIIRIY